MEGVAHSGNANVFQLPDHPSSAAESLAGLRSMQQEGQLCDVVLKTESGYEISAHRVILAGCSDFFKAMFVNKLAESTQRTVTIKDIDFDILQAVVCFAYNSHSSISSDRVLPLLIASDRFQIHRLVVSCSTFLVSQLRPNNCLSLRAYAELHNCQKLHELCTAFVSQHFEEVCQCEEYLSLPVDQLKELIARDDVRVLLEENVYSAVLHWVYHDLDERKENFPDIMSYVRLPFVSSEFLSSEVEQEALIVGQERCQQFVQEAYLYKTSPEKRSSLKHSPRASPRKISGLPDIILSVAGMGCSVPLSSIEQFDTATGKWSFTAEMEFACYGLGACYFNGYLYVAGGYSDSMGYLSAVQCYNLHEKRWKDAAPMKQARRYHHMRELYGLLYVTGGQNAIEVLRTAERYDPATDSWSCVQPMNSPRMYHGLTELDKLLFAVGGHDGQKRQSSVEFYDPALNQWNFVAPMSVARSVSGVASLGSSIYVAGGYNGKENLQSVESYDIELDKWVPAPDMTSKRSAVGLVSHEGCLYACGGFNGSFLSSVECLVQGEDHWKPVVGSMAAGRVHFGITCT